MGGALALSTFPFFSFFRRHLCAPPIFSVFILLRLFWVYFFPAVRRLNLRMPPHSVFHLRQLLPPPNTLLSALFSKPIVACHMLTVDFPGLGIASSVFAQKIFECPACF